MKKVVSRIDLYAHNQHAYEAASALIDKTGKAAVIHPTGTGKSFIGFKLAEQHKEERILWLSPSEYIFKTQKENLQETLCVPEAEKQRILEELTANIKFLTYAKLRMNEDDIEELQPDYIVLDEFHRCGAREWGLSVRKLIAAYPKAKLLGLSATNIRHLDNKRDMAEELFDGCIASEMSLGEAIARRILPAPTYVMSMYSYGEELKRLAKRIENERNPVLKAENEKLIEELRRALENADGLDRVFAKHMRPKKGKYLVFCANKEHMEEMVEQSKAWFRLVDENPHIYAVYYDNPESGKVFAEFKSDESDSLRLLFCIDMLNEGVHVDKIDGVILLRPTVSPILYLQQIGRALSAGKNATPIIFDIVNNFESLYSIDSIQEEFEHTLGLILGIREGKEHFSNRFHIMDEVRDCRRIFAQISSNLTASWEMYYLAAKTYYEEKGHLLIPKGYVTDRGLNLGNWLATQRRVYAGAVAGRLNEEQIKRLEDIGMDWENVNDRKFAMGVEALEAYIRQFGDADVPADYVSASDYPLGRWLVNTRCAYKNGRLDERKIETLNGLGMIWDVREHRWNQNYREAKKYYKAHGNLQVPVNYVTESGLFLGRWVANQIKIHNNRKEKAAELTPLQEQLLEEIGIVWKNKFEDSWDIRYQLAKDFYEKNGNLELPSNYTVDGINVGKWVRNIRLKKTNPSSSNIILSEERIRQMDCIGMRWNKRENVEVLSGK